MDSNVRGRFWLEIALTLLTGSLAALTVGWPDWIEAISGLDPDAHNGSLEWTVVIALALLCAAAGAAGLAEWRRARGPVAVEA